MSHPPDNVEYKTAVAIVDEAIVAAIDNAIEANISGECFAAAVLDHICAALFDQFGQSADDIAMLARTSAANYASRTARRSKRQ
jgi:hypothetical protein